MAIHGTANEFDESGNLIHASPLTRQAIESARIQNDRRVLRTLISPWAKPKTVTAKEWCRMVDTYFSEVT